jgi:hypothetical protein
MEQEMPSMSTEDVRTVCAIVPAGEEQETSAELGWFLAMLQEAMTQVMEGESTPLQKANAVARLGSLYLKSYQTQELERENRELTSKIEALEQSIADLETATDPAPAGTPTSEARHRSAGLSRSRTRPPRGLTRAVRRPVRTDDDRLSLSPPETGFPLHLADEVEITVPPDFMGPTEQ